MRHLTFIVHVVNQASVPPHAIRGRDRLAEGARLQERRRYFLRDRRGYS